MKNEKLTKRVASHPIARKITSHPLTKMIVSHPITKSAAYTSKKAIHFGKTTAAKIKKNPKAAAKYGLKLKICETIISGLICAYGIPSLYIQNNLPFQKPYTNIIYQMPIIRDDSQEYLIEHLEKIHQEKLPDYLS